MATLYELMAELDDRVRHVGAPTPEVAAALIRTHLESDDPDRWKSIATIAIAQEWAYGS